jgi:hypothetical protein
LRGAPIASAKAPCDKFIGVKNSSVKISPTVAGLRFVISMSRLVDSHDANGRKYRPPS